MARLTRAGLGLEVAKGRVTVKETTYKTDQKNLTETGITGTYKLFKRGVDKALDLSDTKIDNLEESGGEVIDAYEELDKAQKLYDEEKKES